MNFSTLIDLCKLGVLSQEEIGSKMYDVPSDVTLEITRECPLNCLICSSNGGEKHPSELSLDKWIDIIDESIELGATSFLISGGEPFSSSYFKTLCEYISEKDVSLSIYTSGNYYDGHEFSSLQYNDLFFLTNLDLVKLVISLEGSNEKTHDFLTGVKGSFNNTMATIRLAVKLGIDTEIHFVPTLINYLELPDVVFLAKKIGVKRASILRFVAQGRGKDNEKLLKLRNDDLIVLRDIFFKLEKYGDYIRIGSPFNPFLLSKNYMCTAGRKRMTIRYDGRVVPCEAMKFMAEGFNDEFYADNDVTIHTLDDIWNISKIFQMSRDFHKIINSECVSCEFLNKCWGGCPAQRILKSDLNNIDPFCSIKIRERELLLIAHD